MRLLVTLLLLACCARASAMPVYGLSDTLAGGRLIPEHTCMDAARTAERDRALPSALLTAIGQVESGRWNSRLGRVAPWPWTVNAEGAGHAFATAQDAIAYVSLLQARGVRSIDVGCLQVNLLYHPDAFASLEQAFDPDANTTYAADFLNRLHARSGSWGQAVGDYHSMAPIEGALYRQRVMLNLANGGAILPVLPPNLAGWPAVTRRASPDRVTILASATAQSVRVIGPDDARASMLHESHMPQVFRP